MLARLACCVLTIVAVATPAYAQPGRAVLQFMAPDGGWADRGFAGGAFVCVQLRSATGQKEECFGFYTRGTGKAVVGGPGVIDSEFEFSKRPPGRFSNAKASVTKPITERQRQRILSFIRGFDKDFSLTGANCVSFSNGVARLAGLKTPTATSPTPVQYLNELRRLNPGS